VSGYLHAPAALPFGVRAPDTDCTGGRVGPRAGLDDVAKRKKFHHFPAGKRTPVIQTVS